MSLAISYYDADARDLCGVSGEDTAVVNSPFASLQTFSLDALEDAGRALRVCNRLGCPVHGGMDWDATRSAIDRAAAAAFEAAAEVAQ
jgi:hypothetical protein